MNNKILLTQNQSTIHHELISIIDVTNSFSLLTNCSITIYNYTDNCIVYANMSNAVNFNINNQDQPILDLNDSLGEEGICKIREVCDYKNSFLKKLNDADKKNMVISGYHHLKDENSIIKNMFYSFLGTTLTYTKEGNIHYELFKTYFSTNKSDELAIFNGHSGERWKLNPVSKRWVKTPKLQFTKLEKEIISLSICGFTSQQIAETIHRSEIAIKKAKSRIIHAVNASTMTEAAFILSNYKFL